VILGGTIFGQTARIFIIQAVYLYNKRNFNASKANAIEQIIYDIYLLVENKEKSKRYCGIFYCGTIFEL
jgi:hypothetical protein